MKTASMALYIRKEKLVHLYYNFKSGKRSKFIKFEKIVVKNFVFNRI